MGRHRPGTIPVVRGETAGHAPRRCRTRRFQHGGSRPRHLGFRGSARRKEGKHFVVVDGREQGPFDLAAWPFHDSENRTICAYFAKQDGKEFVVVSDRRGERFDHIGLDLIVRDDGTVAYPAEANGTWRWVVNGKKGDAFDAVSGPVFSPDGKKLAYGARVGRKVFWKVMLLP
jgi:hypothetical protein